MLPWIRSRLRFAGRIGWIDGRRGYPGEAQFVEPVLHPLAAPAQVAQAASVRAAGRRAVAYGRGHLGRGRSRGSAQKPARGGSQLFSLFQGIRAESTEGFAGDSARRQHHEVLMRQGLFSCPFRERRHGAGGPRFNGVVLAPTYA